MRWLWSPTGRAWGAVVLACVGSRLATTIGYVEDPDSMRFALSVVDGFDVAALQPHFPGYPVFWAAAKSLYLGIGSFSAAFSVVGGVATVGIVAALLHLWRKPLVSVEGGCLAAAVVLNPMVWLMGNRFMPDLLGTACVLGAFALLVRALDSPDDAMRTHGAVWGIALAGLLAGLRLSYLPLVVGPALLVLARTSIPRRLLVAGAASVAVWLVPMIVDTGWRTLVDVAWTQTTGHFTDFGGTVQTESDLGRRVVGVVRALWADGLGAWWPGRHPLTGAVGVGMAGLGGVGAWHLVRSTSWRRAVWMGVGSVALYAMWIFFFQNVIHKSRHVLPLVPLLLVPIAVGAAECWRRATAGRLAVLAVGVVYASVTVVLVHQHRQPSAIAQAKTFVQHASEQVQPTRVATDPLVITYLEAQRVDVPYFSVDDSTDVRQLRQAATGQTLVVGTYPNVLDRPPTRVRRFYHNPYVNRMWPEVTVFVYEH